MPYLPVYMAPMTTSGRMTLQASRETWELLLSRLPDKGPIFRDPIREVITVSIAASDASAIRVEFAEEEARRLLQLAGVSS